jgi:hypothetical protein
MLMSSWEAIFGTQEGRHRCGRIRRKLSRCYNFEREFADRWRARGENIQFAPWPRFAI